MTNFKRFSAAVAATLMAACMVAPMATMNVSASEYQITVKADTDGNVSTISSVKAYKIFNLALGDKQSDDTYKAYTYTVDANCVLTEAEILAIDYNEEDEGGLFTKLDDLLAWLSTEANARIFADKIYTTYSTKLESATASEGTLDATSGTATIDTGAAGYYLVYGVGINKDGAENKNTVISQIMLDSTDTTASINLKLDAPSIDKQIYHDEKGTWGDVGDNQIGENVEYKIITSVPSIAGYTDYQYIIHDSMTDGLSFNSSSVEIYTDEGCTNKVDAKYYTVKTEGLTDGCDFEISIDIDGMVAADVLEANGAEKLYTLYDALLTSDALVAVGAPDDDNHNDNVAYLEYSNNPYATTTGTTAEVEVYDWTFAETITKVKEDGTKLAGATFKVYAEDPVANTSATPLSFIKSADSETYTIDTKNTAGAVTEITSVAESGFVLKGLDDSTTYYLVETKEPDGYAKLTAPKTFILTAGYIANAEGAAETPDNLQTLTDDDTQDGANNLNIVNTAGSALPGTGGIGTTLFYLGGGAMVAVASVYLITKKRMNNADAE